MKVVSLLDDWTSDWGRYIKRVALYISLTACSMGGGLLVGVSLVKAASLLNGWSFVCGRHARRFAPYIF